MRCRAWPFFGVLALLGPSERACVFRPSSELAGFTGTVAMRFEALGVLRRTSYVKGLPHGVEVDQYDGGSVAARRYFSWGRKVGVHEAWYRSGARRAYAEYEDGQPRGDAWEWYESGPPYSFVRFKDHRVVGKKVWREDGQIYSNHVQANGKFVGMPGARLCFQTGD